MGRLILITYFVMSAWLVLGSAGRIALMIGSGQDLDPLPFVSATLGVIALGIFGAAWDWG
ncbi:MAG: hypothetical protein ABWZ77_05130 [Naasia sp.]